jgi:hypothetical protein
MHTELSYFGYGTFINILYIKNKMRLRNVDLLKRISLKL